MLPLPSVRKTRVGVKPPRRTARASEGAGLYAGRKRGRAAAWQAGEASLCADQGACGRQKKGGAFAAEGEDGHFVAPAVAIRQQHFDRALGFREAVEGGGS